MVLIASKKKHTYSPNQSRLPFTILLTHSRLNVLVVLFKSGKAIRVSVFLWRCILTGFVLRVLGNHSSKILLFLFGVKGVTFVVSWRMKLVSLATVTRNALSLDIDTLTLTLWRGEALQSKPSAFVSISRLAVPPEAITLKAGDVVYANADFSGETPFIRVVAGDFDVEAKGASVGFVLRAGDITTRPFHRVGKRAIYATAHRAIVYITNDAFLWALDVFCKSSETAPPIDVVEMEVVPDPIEELSATVPTRSISRVTPYVLHGNAIGADFWGADQQLIEAVAPSSPEAKDIASLGFELPDSGAPRWGGGLLDFLNTVNDRGFETSIDGSFRPKFSVQVEKAKGGYSLRITGVIDDLDITPISLFGPSNSCRRRTRSFNMGDVRCSFDIPSALAAFLVAVSPYVGDQIDGVNHVYVRAGARRVFAIYARAQWSEFDFISDTSSILPEDCPDVPLTPSFRGDFMEHQFLPYRWMADLADNKLGGILADDMRMGKSVVSIAIMARSVDLSGGKCVVVCPPDVIEGWVRKLAEFAPGLRPAVMVGDIKDKGPILNQLDRGDFDVLFVSLFSLDSKNTKKALKRKFACSFLDEAHLRKNPDSNSYAVMVGINADARFVLSGTPIENRPLDAWSLLHLCLPNSIISSEDFCSLFDNPISAGCVETAKALAEFLAPFVLRRTRSSIDGVYVPPVVSIKYTALLKSQASQYASVLNDFRKEHADLLSRNDADGKMNFFEHGDVLRTINTLRALCSFHSTNSGRTVSSGKFPNLMDMIRALKGESFLVFSSWVDPLIGMERIFKENQITSACLTGRFKRPERAEILGKFRDRKIQGVLATTKLGSVGVDLPEADHVFILDPWWNPFVESQAAARAEMLSKKRGISVTRLIAKGTIEERVLRIQDHKRDVFEAIFGNGATIKPKLTISLVQDLLGED